MASKHITCAGCLKTVKGKQFLKCINCDKTYDLLCAGVSEKRYKNLYCAVGGDRKSVWTCPECINKKPKGDTTNTPVRRNDSRERSSEETPEDSPPIGDNVTLRSNRMVNADGDLTDLIKKEIRNAIRAEMAPMNEKLFELQSSVQYISNQYDALIKTTNTIMQDYKNMESNNERLHSMISSLNLRINVLEQHLRENNLEIQGVPEQKNENIVTIVNRIADVVSHKLKDEDLLNCTRVAHKNKDNKNPRAIIVQLRSNRCRDEFYSAVARYNRSHPSGKLGSFLLDYTGPNSPIYVSEHLSPANKSLHAATRAKAKELAYKFVWVRNGRIFMRKNETSPFIHIRSEQTLNLLD